MTVMVGPEQRLFAAHENVLSASPFFASAIRDAFFQGGPGPRRIYLPEEEPECFSAVLEYMYKGDYYPRLSHDKRRNTWELDSTVGPESPKFPGDGFLTSIEPTIYHYAVGDRILRDTAVYCAAVKYGLDELQRLALRKQGLQSGIEVAVILRSARFCYDNTPDHDSRLRAHYIALIIRSRKTFKRSGTMQKEMEFGGKLFFDLFVAMCNNMDDMGDQLQVPRFLSPSDSVCLFVLHACCSFAIVHCVFRVPCFCDVRRGPEGYGIANTDLTALPEEHPGPSNSCTSVPLTHQQFSTHTGNNRLDKLSSQSIHQQQIPPDCQQERSISLRVGRRKPRHCMRIRRFCFH